MLNQLILVLMSAAALAQSSYTVRVPPSDVAKLQSKGYYYIRVRQHCRNSVGMGLSKDGVQIDLRTPSSKDNTFHTYKSISVPACDTNTKSVACGVNIGLSNINKANELFCGLNPHVTPNKDPNDTFCRTNTIDKNVFKSISRNDKKGTVSIDFILSTANRACQVYL
jgi:hypothetical protein